jgi:hypothetical protein
VVFSARTVPLALSQLAELKSWSCYVRRSGAACELDRAFHFTFTGERACDLRGAPYLLSGDDLQQSLHAVLQPD